MGNVNASAAHSALENKPICDALSSTDADIEKLKKLRKSPKSHRHHHHRSHHHKRNDSLDKSCDSELIDEVYDFIKEVKKDSKQGNALLKQFVELQTTGTIQKSHGEIEDVPPVPQIFIVRDQPQQQQCRPPARSA